MPILLFVLLVLALCSGGYGIFGGGWYGFGPAGALVIILLILLAVGRR
jgi:hypothetical protein